MIILLKNPSRTTKNISDKTVFTVTNYINKNQDPFNELKNIGTVMILNFIPFYKAYSGQLVNSKNFFFHKENLETIKYFTLR